MVAAAARLIDLAVHAAGGRTPIFLGGIEGVTEPVTRVRNGAEFGYWLLDTTLTVDGRKVVIEANGSNGATSSIGGDDEHRVAHMVASLEARGAGGPGEVVLLGHQDGFHHIPEFYARALRLVCELGRHGAVVVARGPNEPLDPAACNVVVGDLRSIAQQVTVVGPAMVVDSLPVTFASNPNLLPAVARAGQSIDGIDLGIFHDGALTPITHDKRLQQELCAATPFEVLANEEAGSPEEAAAAVARLHQAGRAAVVKPNGTSGGVGIRVIPIGRDPLPVVEELVAETVARYGPGSERTLLPLRTFEFAEAAHLPFNGGEHLWDLRIEVLAWPGGTSARPVMVRVCPAPFSPDLAHESVVSNLTGRVPSTDFILGPAELDRRLASNVVTELVGAALAWGEQAAAWRPT